MSFRSRCWAVMAGATALALAACGGQGLPPKGPNPGEVDTGYGTEPKDKQTGAVTTVQGANVGDLRAGGVEELLRGRVAGLEIVNQPGGGYRFRIRGASTISGESPEPLFIVDGKPVSPGDLVSALAGLTRDDIRQVDVLKDVASTSMYGMRGAGGVVIISTNRR